MGWLAQTLARFEVKAALGAAVPTWEVGQPQAPGTASGGSYQTYAREGHSGDSLVYSCIEELCTSAAEPRFAAYRKTRNGPEKVEPHPLLDLLERPNPFMTRYDLIAGTILHLNIAGNAYLQKQRSAAGKVVELWPLRPDRMRVIPDATRFIRGYEYTIGNDTHLLPTDDVLHFKLRSGTDDYYGLAPLAVVATWVDVDRWAAAFSRAFFANSGVPAGLLKISRSVTAAERELIRNRWRNETGGPGGWHSLLVLDNVDAEFVAMGLPPGGRGLAIPELDEILESRICSAFGVPLELIGARLGKIHGNRTTTEQERASFWYETLMPLYVQLAGTLTLGLVGEYDGVDYLEVDTSTVKALQENEDAKHARVRADLLAGILTREEARTALGLEPEVTEGTWVLPSTIGATPVEIGGQPEPLPVASEAVSGLDEQGKQYDPWSIIDEQELDELRRRATALAPEAPLWRQLLAGRNGHAD